MRWLLVLIGPLMGAISWFATRLLLKRVVTETTLSDVINAIYTAMGIELSALITVFGVFFAVVIALLLSRVGNLTVSRSVLPNKEAKEKP